MYYRVNDKIIENYHNKKALTIDTCGSTPTWIYVILILLLLFVIIFIGYSLFK